MLKRLAIGRALDFMRGNIRVLTINQMLGMFGFSMVFPYASLYILALGGEPAQIGQINSLAPLAGLLVFPIAGYITDHVGRVKLIALTGYLGGAIFLLMAFAPDWRLLIVAALFMGLQSMQFPPTSAILADSLAPRDRGRGIAIMNTLSGAPALFAPYIAGTLLSNIGVESAMRYLYAFLALTSVVTATINLRFLQETQTATQGVRLPDLIRALKDTYGGLPGLLRRLPRSLRALGVVITLGFMSNAIAGPFWVIFAADYIGLSAKEWGLILLLESVMRNLVYIPAGTLIDRHGRLLPMIGSLLLSLVSVPLFVFARGFTAVLLIRLAVAIANAFFLPACAAFMADIVPRDIRGRVMAAMGGGIVMLGIAGGGNGGPGVGFLITIPLMVSSFAAGYLYDHNAAYPWFFVFFATLISLVVAGLFVREPREAEI